MIYKILNQPENKLGACSAKFSKFTVGLFKLMSFLIIPLFSKVVKDVTIFFFKL